MTEREELEAAKVILMKVCEVEPGEATTLPYLARCAADIVAQQDRDIETLTKSVNALIAARASEVR